MTTIYIVTLIHTATVVAGLLGTALGAGAVFWLSAVNLSAISYMARRSD